MGPTTLGLHASRPRFAAILAASSGIALTFAGSVQLAAAAEPIAPAHHAPVQLKDVKPGSDTSRLSQFAGSGGSLFFVADDRAHGRELWTSNGTTAGTKLVKDIRSAPNAAGPKSLTDVAGTLFFSADDGSHGRELWTSDGTPEGTHQVKDINRGAAGSGPIGLVAVGEDLFFSATDALHGRELWISDGTRAGTHRVSDIKLGAGSATPRELTAFGATLFFTADDGRGGRDLWRTDGTPGGTLRVRHFSAANQPFELTAAGDALFFGSNAGSCSTRRGCGWGLLWTSDGTPSGTQRVPSGTRTPVGVGDLTDVGGTLFFGASIDGQAHGQALWKSNGTAGGTKILKNGIYPGYLRNADGRLYFAVQGTDGVSTDLWTSDATRTGTQLLVRHASLGDAATLGTSLVFRKGAGLWSSNGAPSGTARVGAGMEPIGMTTVGQTIFFSGVSAQGRELWSYTP